MTTNQPTAYRIFLVTFWQEASDRADPETWRFRLEEPRGGQRQGYVGVTALVAGLIRMIGNDEDAEEGLS